jgi:hypothetical protein
MRLFDTDGRVFFFLLARGIYLGGNLRNTFEIVESGKETWFGGVCGGLLVDCGIWQGLKFTPPSGAPLPVETSALYSPHPKLRAACTVDMHVFR